MEHSIFLLINFALMGIVYYIDRENILDHIVLGILAFFGAIVFEIIPIMFGFWTHYSEPKIWLLSLYSFLLYFPFISFSYFLARKVFK
ncbi:TPA: hypothetical protein HA235_00840 [Candidatus Woesearchaeota archaeon]|nr:hypothetical protein [Candidatus Woesearchaeota archaeon]HIH31231.1 hypothetical protein [Candidatus Woesearchaeota archaeon]HIH54656.1 hypothetical protein [Candidatus Woesearchaeota archaeon]HIJ01388.1 hypothetical protein [Candidatus Woesearchaeota archaeon]HIJ14287.1 hypothetical protein [Candidatus Woesearchaeota archaeon]